jgi:hypothetical protein
MGFASLNPSYGTSPLGANALKLPRRRFLQLAARAAALSALSSPAVALDYPSRPVRIVVGYPAGGVSDILPAW